MPDLFSSAQMHDPGGKVRHFIAAGMDATAVFGGPLDCYRYRLTRTWRTNRPGVLIVMMNPSVADIHVNDPTVAKVTRMAQRWHNGAYGTLMVGNCFAYRSTDQNELGVCQDPIGPDNDRHLRDMACAASLIIMAYGTPKIGRLRARGPDVIAMLREARCTLHVLRHGANAPWHPLYLPDDTEPVLWP